MLLLITGWACRIAARRPVGTFDLCVRRLHKPLNHPQPRERERERAIRCFYTRGPWLNASCWSTSLFVGRTYSVPSSLITLNGGVNHGPRDPCKSMTILTGLRAGSIQLLVELSVCEYSRILSVSATLCLILPRWKTFCLNSMEFVTFNKVFSIFSCFGCFAPDPTRGCVSMDPAMVTEPTLLSPSETNSWLRPCDIPPSDCWLLDICRTILSTLLK